MTSDQIFKILGNKIRLRILSMLAEKPLRVGEMSKISGMSMTMISKDLMRLRAKRIVAAERRGIFITYSIAKTEDAALVRKLISETKGSSPREVMSDSENSKKIVVSISGNSNKKAEAFTGNHVAPKKQQDTGTQLGTSEEQYTHFGNLPTNLL